MSEYISRDELVDTLDERIEKCEEALPLTPAQVHEMKGEVNATKAIRVFVKRFPAADVRPVVRGKWIIDRAFGNDVMSNEQMVICSACHKGIFWGKQNFCPNCGADMREATDG